MTSPDTIDRAFTRLFTLVALSSWIGFTLAEFGFYRPLWLAVGLGAGLAMVWWWSRARDGSPARVDRPGPWHVPSLIVWIGLAFVLMAKPGEYVINGSDGSVYLNIGRAIARHGGVTFDEPLLTTLSPADRAALLERGRGAIPVYDLFPGGMQADVEGTRVRPNFFHLLPVWIANLELVAGPKAGYYVSSFFGVLSVATAWLLGRRLLSLTAGNVAAGLLCVNFSEVWFARFPTSEMLTQGLVLAGLYFTLATARSSQGAGLLAGAAFGLAACARVDVLFLVSPVVAASLVMVVLARAWSPAWTAMAIVFGLITLQAIAHAAVIATPYTLRVLNYAFGGRTVSYLGLALPLVVLGAGALVWVARRRSTRMESRWLLRAAGAVAGGLVIWRLGPDFLGGYLAMLVTPAGILAALAGMIWLLRDDASPERALVAGVFLASALVYTESVRDPTGMPLLFRRFVTVVVPVTALMTGYLVARLAALGRWWRLTAFVLPVLIAIPALGQIRPLLAATPMRGLHDHMAAAVGALPEGALVVTDASTPSHFGLSLRYTFGRDVIYVHAGPGKADAIARLVGEAGRQNRRVILAVGRDSRQAGALSAVDVVALRLAPAGSLAFNHLELESTRDRFPSTLRTMSPIVEFFTAEVARPAELPVAIDIGDHDLGWRLSGFYGREALGGAASRWTREVAEISLPRIARAPDEAVLALRLAAPRPEGATAASVRVELDGELVGITPPLGYEFMTIELPLAAPAIARLAAGRSVLRLTSPTFVPAERGGNSDTRTLGVVVDWIRVEGRGR